MLRCSRLALLGHCAFRRYLHHLPPRAFKVAYAAQVADPEQRAEFQRFVSSCGSAMFPFDIGARFRHFQSRSIPLRRTGNRLLWFSWGEVAPEGPSKHSQGLAFRALLRKRHACFATSDRRRTDLAAQRERACLDYFPQASSTRL
jgi:hypothetical protein